MIVNRCDNGLDFCVAEDSNLIKMGWVNLYITVFFFLFKI